MNIFEIGKKQKMIMKTEVGVQTDGNFFMFNLHVLAHFYNTMANIVIYAQLVQLGRMTCLHPIFL